MGLGLVVQSLLRHTMSLMLSEGIVNELLVTNSEEANRELTKLHEQLFNRASLLLVPHPSSPSSQANLSSPPSGVDKPSLRQWRPSIEK